MLKRYSLISIAVVGIKKMIFETKIFDKRNLTYFLELEKFFGKFIIKNWR